MGDPETLHQIKLIAKNVQLLEDLLYSHNHRHVYNGGDPLFGLDTSQIETGVFDLDRIPTPLKSKILSEVFTAGADITTGQVVAITGDNEVSPADNTLRSQTIGVALNDAAVGEQVEVVIYGKTTVVADGVVSAGDPLAAATTAGRVVSLLSHSHTNPNTSSVDLAHTHTNPNTSTIGNHSHTNPNTSSVGLAHTHSNPNTSTTGSHTHTNPATASAGGHDHNIDAVWEFTSETEGHTHGYWRVEGIITGGVHSHTQGWTGSAGSHSHTQGATGSALGFHSHTQDNTGLSGSHFHTQNPTGSALGVHSHTQDDTGVVNNAQIVGKALTAAVGAGVEIEILVCLAG